MCLMACNMHGIYVVLAKHACHLRVFQKKHYGETLKNGVESVNVVSCRAIHVVLAKHACHLRVFKRKHYGETLKNRL